MENSLCLDNEMVDAEFYKSLINFFSHYHIKKQDSVVFRLFIYNYDIMCVGYYYYIIQSFLIYLMIIRGSIVIEIE